MTLSRKDTNRGRTGEGRLNDQSPKPRVGLCVSARVALSVSPTQRSPSRGGTRGIRPPEVLLQSFFQDEGFFFCWTADGLLMVLIGIDIWAAGLMLGSIVTGFHPLLGSPQVLWVGVCVCVCVRAMFVCLVVVGRHERTFQSDGCCRH